MKACGTIYNCAYNTYTTATMSASDFAVQIQTLQNTLMQEIMAGRQEANDNRDLIVNKVEEFNQRFVVLEKRVDNIEQCQQS